MCKKVVIFDFDGTIADSFKALVKIANDLSPEFGYPAVTQEEIVRLSNLSSQEVVLQSPIPLYKIPFLLRRIKKELNKHIVNLKPFLGIQEALAKFKQEEICLGIVTSNMRDNVITFLENNGLEGYFDFICSANTIFGKDKILRKVISKYNFPAERIYYVGDETRDIEAAKKSQIKIISVSWGFNSADALQKYQPDFLISEPAQLNDILSEHKEVERVKN